MSVWISFHRWCGFGGNLGLFPEVRLGVLRLGCCKGAIGAKVRAAREQVEITYRHLFRKGGAQ